MSISPYIKDRVTQARKQTLYVHRKVINGSDLLQWAKINGLPSIIEVDDLHVTQMFSKAPVLWAEIPPLTNEVFIGTLGLRSMDKFGDALVLKVRSDDLSNRFNDFMMCGCSYDFPSYQPHITISYKSDGIDPLNIWPFSGPIILGPEIFQPVNLDWKSNVKEV